MRDKQGQTSWASWVHVMWWSWYAVPAKGASTAKVLCLQQVQESGALLHSANYTRLSFQSLSKDEAWTTAVEMFALPLLLSFNADEGQRATASSAGDLSLFSVHTSIWQEAAQSQSARHQFWCSIAEQKIYHTIQSHYHAAVIHSSKPLRIVGWTNQYQPAKGHEISYTPSRLKSDESGISPIQCI